MRSIRSLAAMLLLAAVTTTAASASCGSAFCPIDSNALNLPATGSWAADLSFQYIDQDQPRIGTRSASVGEIPSDHDEVRTINRVLNLSLHYAPQPGLMLGLTVPWVDRFHQHVAHPDFAEALAVKHGGAEEEEREQWTLRGMGDVTLDAQWRAWIDGRTSVWLTGALKLPTGKDDRGNGEEVAELPIQTGTGSTDVTIGAVARGSFVHRTAIAGPMGSFGTVPWFASISYRTNGRGRDDYRIGSEWQANLGAAYPLGSRLDAMLQLNVRDRGRDDPGHTDEDPALTGGRYVFLSPGIRLVVREPWALYAFVQQPLYQDVNGLQLTAKRNWLFGFQGRL